MPTSIRVTFGLCLLLVAWQCYAFVMAFSHMPPPGMIASTLGFVLQEFFLLWLVWMLIRRRSLGRWLLLLWFLIRLGLPIWLKLSFATFSAFWHSLMATRFWLDTETIDMIIWFGILYFAFARSSKIWFRPPPEAPDLRQQTGMAPPAE